jgi:hypothetical protein
MRHSPLPSATRRRTVLLLVLGAMLNACSDGPTGLRGPTVSGTIVNRSGAPIPATARVVVLWSTANESVAYIFGEGTIDRTTNRFSVTFDRDLPTVATYDGALGIGVILLTTDPDLRDGPLAASADYYASTIVGVTGQHAVIFMGTDPSQYGADWAASFRRGYNVGRGVDLPGLFDGFAPVSFDSMQLIVDDLADIELVNWT